MITDYLLALATTLLLELPVVMWMAGALPIARVLGVALFANLASHGALWLAFDPSHEGYYARLALAETGVVVFEAAMLWMLARLPVRRALAASVLANAISTAAGFAMWALRDG